MTAARISPAANLLRNSKLFAIPPAIALPTPEPSSEPVPRSDTATSIFPTRAAIETPLTSLGKGDWGFKRPLPLKSTTKSGSPSVRLNKGIDTREHIADFDSAADHVITLKKFQELNQPIEFPRTDDVSKLHLGVFRKRFDNTTNASGSAPHETRYSGVWPSVSPAAIQNELPNAVRSRIVESIQDSTAKTTRNSQNSIPVSTKRWRYEGPSLVHMSGLEFDRWIKTIDSSKRRAFREAVKRDMLATKKRDHVAQARELGTVGEVDAATISVSEEEVTEYLRRLRQQPGEFGRLMAEFLDLPEGPTGKGVVGKGSNPQQDEVWTYGRTTVASNKYEETGPPATHPSAGLSYIHSDRWVQNHALFGPQDMKQSTVARAVKIRTRGATNIPTFGVAGFIVEKERYKGLRNPHEPGFEPVPGGQKTTVIPEHATVDQKGALKMTVRAAAEYLVEDEKAVHNSMVKNPPLVEPLQVGRRARSRVMQPLTRDGVGDMAYKKREPLASGEDDFAFLGKTS